MVFSEFAPLFIPAKSHVTFRKPSRFRALRTPNGGLRFLRGKNRKETEVGNQRETDLGLGRTQVPRPIPLSQGALRLWLPHDPSVSECQMHRDMNESAWDPQNVNNQGASSKLSMSTHCFSHVLYGKHVFHPWLVSRLSVCRSVTSPNEKMIMQKAPYTGQTPQIPPNKVLQMSILPDGTSRYLSKLGCC